MGVFCTPPELCFRPAQQTLLEVLVANQKLLDTAIYQDVTFVCRDGVSIPANRAYLAARCNYFHNLLYGGMKESREQQIDFSHVTAEAFRIVVDFLHTCRSERISKDGYTVEAFMLAEQFNISSLKQAVQQFMVANLLPSDVGPVLSSCLSHQAEELAAIVADLYQQWDFNYNSFSGFSLAAVEFFLYRCKVLQIVSDYVLLRALLVWSGFEDKRNDGTFCNDAKTSERCAVVRLLISEYIDLAKVPAVFIAEVLEPLGILSLDTLLEVYRASALCIREKSIWDETCLGAGMETSPCSPTLLRSIVKGPMHRVARTTASFCSGRHVWTIRVRDSGSDASSCLASVGVVDKSYPEQLSDLNTFPRQRQIWGYVYDGSLDDDGIRRKLSSGYSLGGYKKVVTVVLDMTEKTLSFKTQGKQGGVAFSNLPSRVRPFVCLWGSGEVDLVYE